MSAQEILIEEIKHQPETVAREVLHYLKFINGSARGKIGATCCPPAKWNRKS